MPQYNLVNPLILGTLNTSIDADNSQIAAREIYQRVSKYFGKVQNKFVFTLQQSNSKKNNNDSDKHKFYSFKVNEVEKDNGEVDFTIANFTGGVDKNKLINNINLIQKKINSIKKYKLNNDFVLDSESISNTQEGGKNDDEEKMFRKALDELDEELEDINSSMKYNKKKDKVEMINVISSPINYITVPDLINPIDYYLYTAIYENLNTIMIPTFIPTIYPTVKLYLNP